MDYEREKDILDSYGDYLDSLREEKKKSSDYYTKTDIISMGFYSKAY
jgi:hypothetical protein